MPKSKKQKVARVFTATFFNELPVDFTIQMLSYLSSCREAFSVSLINSHNKAIVLAPEHSNLLLKPFFDARWPQFTPIIIPEGSDAFYLRTKFIGMHSLYKRAMRDAYILKSDTWQKLAETADDRQKRDKQCDRILASDRKFVLAQANNPVTADRIRFASALLRDDKEIVLAALVALKSRVGSSTPGSPILSWESFRAEFGAIYNSLSDRLKEDAGFCHALLALDSYLISTISPVLRNNDEFMRKVLKKHPEFLEYASETLKSNQDLLLTLIKQSYKAFSGISEQLKNDRAFILQAVSLNGHLLVSLSDNFRSDEDIALLAIENNPGALKLVDKALKQNHAFILKALKLNEGALNHVPKKVKDNPEFIAALAEQNNALQLSSAASSSSSGVAQSPSSSYGMTRVDMPSSSFFSAASSSASSSSSSAAAAPLGVNFVFDENEDYDARPPASLGAGAY